MSEVALLLSHSGYGFDVNMSRFRSRGPASDGCIHVIAGTWPTEGCEHG